MSSWWKKIALRLGATEGPGSWDRRVARELEAETADGNSGAAKILAEFPELRHQLLGSYTKRLVRAGSMISGPAAKSLYFDRSELVALDPTPDDQIPVDDGTDDGDGGDEDSDWILATGAWRFDGFWRNDGAWNFGVV
jgi:hypothetical protein